MIAFARADGVHVEESPWSSALAFAPGLKTLSEESSIKKQSFDIDIKLNIKEPVHFGS